MPRLVSFLAAEGIAIDQLTSRVTVFNTIDHLLVPKLPARLVRLSVLSFYELGDELEPFLERVHFVSPEGTIAATSESSVVLPPRDAGKLPNGHRSLHVFWGLQLEHEGDYHLTLEHKIEGAGDWTPLASLCITALVQLHPILNAQAPSVSIPPSASRPDLTSDK